jgi:hypothetical protein
MAPMTEEALYPIKSSKIPRPYFKNIIIFFKHHNNEGL